MSNQPSGTAEAKEEIVGSIVSAFDTLTHKLRQEIRKRPLTDNNLADGHIYMLVVLSQSGVMKASDLSAEIGITSGAVTGLSDKLASLGLINRERSEEDRRVVRLSLTEEGRSCLARIHRERLDRIADLFYRLNEEDLGKLLDIYRKLIAIIDDKDKV